MGKNNKKRKRANHALFHAVKARKNGEEAPLPEPTPRKNQNDDEEAAEPTQDISDQDLTTTLKTLEKLVSNPALFHSKRFKDLRRTLHPLVVEQLQSYDKGIDYRHKVTLALQHGHWSDAMAALQACQDFQQIPKQGTVQRWVRDCMAAANGTVKMQLLQAILKVSASAQGAAGDGNKHDPAQAWADQLASNVQAKDGITILPGWKWWEHTEEETASNNSTTKENIKDEKKVAAADQDDKNSAKEEEKPGEEKEEPKEATKIEEEKPKPDDNSENSVKLESRILYREAAAERTPPNHYDLLLHTTQPGSIQWASTPPPTASHAIPFLPAPARVIANVLTPDECHQLRQAMTTLGFRPDQPVALDSPTGIDSCEWMVDDEIAAKLLERVQPHLPDTLTLPHGQNHRTQVQLYSINPRWRGFRYGPDCVYRPHLDGSWPHSFVTPEGTYACPKQSAIKSYLTFLIYLNDDFEGGETRFYLPQGIARGIVPKLGSVAIFPQGNMASLIHEGSQVTKGVKYVVRTDVLYRPMIAGQQQQREEDEKEDVEETTTGE